MGVLVFLATPLYGQKPTAKLNWLNGDRLPVLPLRADEDTLVVQSPLFRDPLEIDFDVLSRITWEPTAKDDGKPQSPYVIQTTDGQTLFANILALNDKTLQIESDRTGQVELDRDRIGSIINLERTETVVSGTFNLDKWDAKRGQKKYWKVNDRGQLESNRKNIHLFLKSELPESCLIAVEIAWQKNLDFSLALGVPNSARQLSEVPRLESWDDAIVFSYGDDFEIIVEELDESEKRLKFLLHWDQSSKLVVIHDERGKVLATADLKGVKTKATPGIYIDNKSGDLKVSSLSIRSSGAGFDATQPSIQIAEKPALNAKLKSFDGKVWLAEDGEGEMIEIPEDKFGGTFLLNSPVDDTITGDRIKFTDGFFLQGKLLSLSNGQVNFRSSIAEKPVTLKLDRVAHIQFDDRKASAKTTASPQRLFNAAGSIGGKLELGSGEAGDIIRWRLVGGKQPVPFLGSMNESGGARVVLQKRKKQSKTESKWRDTLYLKNRDMVPCTITKMDEENVYVDSFFANKLIPESLIKAAHFQGGGETPAEVSLNDDVWVTRAPGKKKLKIKNDALQITAGSKAFHPWLFSRGGFEFDLDWPESMHGYLKLRMGSDDKSISKQGVSLMLWGQSVGVGSLDAGNAGGQQKPRGSDSVKVKLQLKDEEIHVYLDGKKTYSQKIKVTDKVGLGIEFALDDQFRQKISCEISNLKILKGPVALLQVDSQRKEFLLTIPRLKTRNLPKQILCANNRDMVRGQLLSMTDEFVSFRSNNVVNRYPRSVLTSMVWIDQAAIRKQLEAEKTSDTKTEATKPPEELAAKKPEETDTANNGQEVQLLLQGGRRITMDLKTRTDDGALVGDSQALGQCEIPLDQIYEMRFGDFASKATDIAYSDWVAKLAPKPKLETGGQGEDGGEWLFGSSSPLIGTAPSFSISLLDGSTTTLKKHEGKVVVLDFWATWCGPCVKALPDVQDVCDDYSADEVALFAINQSEGKKQIKKFLKDRGWDLTVGLDKGELSKQFSVEAIPQTVIIDREGVVRFVKVGGSLDLKEKLRAAIEELMID